MYGKAQFKYVSQKYSAAGHIFPGPGNLAKVFIVSCNQILSRLTNQEIVFVNNDTSDVFLFYSEEDAGRRVITKITSSLLRK